MRLTRRLAARLPAAVALAAALLAGAPAGAAGRPPELEKFVARYNAPSTTTFYIVTAGDPDGGRLTYQWTLKADCGLLIEPVATGPSNGYQFGPPARRPDGCPTQDQSRATVTVRIVDSEGCAIVYSQRARDETEHVRPSVRAEPCPPRPAGEEGKGFPAGLVVAGIIIAAGAWAFATMRTRRPEGERAPWEKPQPEPSASPDVGSAPSIAETAFRAPGEATPARSGALEWERSGEALDLEAGEGLPIDAPLASLSLPDEPCEEGESRGEGRDLVAHDTVLAGAVRASAGDRTIEIPPHDAREILRLAADIPPDKPLEVEVEVPLRLVTVVASRREVCRGGRWVPEASSTTHDGPERTERLRAIAAAPEDLVRFADEILARRLRTLADARRRLEAALSTGRMAESPRSPAGD